MARAYINSRQRIYRKRNLLSAGRPTYLGAGISLDDIIEAMQDPRKRLEFPIKPFRAEMDLSNATKGIIIFAATAITAGLIYNATRKKK